MLPVWMLIAQGVKQIADNQNEQANSQSNTQNTQTVNSNGNSNAFSTVSSIYNNYLNDDKDKKNNNWFSQIFGR